VRCLLGSFILIDHFNNIKTATTFLAEYGSECAISVITRTEVLAGFTVRTEPPRFQLERIS